MKTDIKPLTEKKNAQLVTGVIGHSCPTGQLRPIPQPLPTRQKKPTTNK